MTHRTALLNDGVDNANVAGGSRRVTALGRGAISSVSLRIWVYFCTRPHLLYRIYESPKSSVGVSQRTSRTQARSNDAHRKYAESCLNRRLPLTARCVYQRGSFSTVGV